MTKNDKKHLLLFVRRLGMYIFTQDKNNIISYIHGCEAGRMGKCLFTKQFSERVAKKYRVQPRAMGLWGQLDTLSKKTGQSWKESFELVALEVLEPTISAV